jgi:hypothetical protein
MPEWSGSTGELVWSQCDAGQCGQACCRGKFEHGWGVEGDCPLEALGVSPGQAWPRAPSQHVQHVSQDPHPFLPGSSRGSVHHDRAEAGHASHDCHNAGVCIILFYYSTQMLLLPHNDHGGDWCLGLRRRQKLQFQPHPSLQHSWTAGCAQGG